VFILQERVTLTAGLSIARISCLETGLLVFSPSNFAINRPIILPAALQ
jgi:hypothetical protein